MGNENFRFHALRYLNGWCEIDEPRWRELSDDEDRETRLRAVQKIARRYKISRNFRKLQDEFNGSRLTRVLDALDSIKRPDTPEDVDGAVNTLANRFKEEYGKITISAASKFLWFRYRSPVVIYDSRAHKGLNNLLKKTGNDMIMVKDHDYPAYRKVWSEQFGQREVSESIEKACDELVSVKPFSFAWRMSDENFTRIVESRWFHERVFDDFLWWKGNYTPQSLARG
ncbi:MAG: hypothetical protein ACRD19_08575 [Terriglobia bacterium]